MKCCNYLKSSVKKYSDNNISWVLCAIWSSPQPKRLRHRRWHRGHSHSNEDRIGPLLPGSTLISVLYTTEATPTPAGNSLRLHLQWCLLLFYLMFSRKKNVLQKVKKDTFSLTVDFKAQLSWSWVCLKRISCSFSKSCRFKELLRRATPI